jgi:glycosyltransferase involved in cell wall biosynthesis
MAGKPLSICHLGKFYPPAPGGIETHVQTLARGQAELGARVSVICINHANRAGIDVTWSRYGATQTVVEQDGDVHVTRLGRSASMARLDIVPGLPKLLGNLQYSDIDVLHLHMPNPTMLLAAASLRLAIPLIITHHSDVIRQRLLRWFYRPFESLVYARASAIACSSAGYVEGSPLLQQHVEKVELLPMGLDLSEYTDPPSAALRQAADLKRRHGNILWLCVGRCVYYKGLHTAIDALAKVPGKLIIIGSGPLEVSLRDHARRLGVADRIVWWGYASKDELIGAYRAATALWFPSSHRSEAFGLVQVEAMASKCPVINTGITGSGVAWVSRHEETGLTVAVNDPDALAAAASRLLRDPSFHASLASTGQQRAVSEFNHHTMAQRSLEIYERAAVRGKKVMAAEEPTRPGLSRWVREMMETNPLDFEHETSEVS